MSHGKPSQNRARVIYPTCTNFAPEPFSTPNHIRDLVSGQGVDEPLQDDVAGAVRSRSEAAMRTSWSHCSAMSAKSTVPRNSGSSTL